MPVSTRRRPPLLLRPSSQIVWLAALFALVVPWLCLEPRRPRAAARSCRLVLPSFTEAAQGRVGPRGPRCGLRVVIGDGRCDPGLFEQVPQGAHARTGRFPEPVPDN